MLSASVGKKQGKSNFRAAKIDFYKKEGILIFFHKGIVAYGKKIVIYLFKNDKILPSIRC